MAVDMKKRQYTSDIAFRISEAQREAITRLADTEELSLGQVARELLDLGLKTRTARATT
jgi:hypothetical protein